ncbi:helix-turn-helix domain-containing protein, partial [Symbiobacterium thermophilum]
ATNLDIEERIRQGLFRMDLYYRLNVCRIVIPPLRERKEDILPMALMYLIDFSRARGRRFTGISDEAAEVLLSYHWPGNCRELRNLMEWVSFMYDDEVLRPEHLRRITDTAGAQPYAGVAPDGEAAPHPGDPPGGTVVPFPRGPRRDYNLEHHTEALIQAALLEYGGNKTLAAKALGISVRTLYNRLERMGQR